MGLQSSLPVLDIFLAIFQILSKIWDALPKEEKEKIINAIVDYFEELFRAYYRKYSGTNK